MDEPSTFRCVPRCEEDGGGGGENDMCYVQWRLRLMWSCKFVVIYATDNNESNFAHNLLVLYTPIGIDSFVTVAALRCSY